MVCGRKLTPQKLLLAFIGAISLFVILQMTLSKYKHSKQNSENKPQGLTTKQPFNDVALQEGIMSEYEKNNALVQKCVDDVVYMEPKLKVVPAEMSGEDFGKTDEVPCTIAKIVSPEKVLVFPVCVYNPAQDASISTALLHKTEVFEQNNLLGIARWLLEIEDAGLIDIGANIGLFTMMAATLDFPVLAVEPKAENILRIKKAAGLKQVGQHLTLLQNGISDVRSRMRLITHRKEQGRTVVVCNKLCRNYDNDVCLDTTVDTILMDDLLNVIPFKKAVMKMDIEGHEIRAFARSEIFFREVHVPLILMEWAWRQNFQSRSEEDRKEVEAFIDLLLSRGYEPQHESGKVLKVQTWDSWPNDVYWVLKK